MPKYYVITDAIPENYRLIISKGSPMDAAIIAIRNAAMKYHVLYEPSFVYVDERGFRSGRQTCTNIFSTTEVLKKIGVR